ncbi:MAG: hypothetical protein Q8S00_24885 [Deltaproteobacteria bacterium]|nr:hypothetical protein [Deltaproteobacteria bacterium]
MLSSAAIRAAGLQHCDIFGIHFPSFDGHKDGGVVGAAETIDTDGFTAQLVRFLDLGAGDEQDRELVFQGRNDHHRRAARRSYHRRRGCRLSELKTAAEQRLNVRRAGLDQNDF